MSTLAYVVEYVEGRPRPLDVPLFRKRLVRHPALMRDGPDPIVAYVEEVIGAKRGHPGMFSFPQTPPSREQRALTVLAHYAKIVATTVRMPETTVVPALVDILRVSLADAAKIKLWNEVLFNVVVLVNFSKLSRHLDALDLPRQIGAWNHQVEAVLRGVEKMYRHRPAPVVLQKWRWVWDAYVRVNALVKK